MSAAVLPPAAAPAYPFASHWLDVNGGRMHYLDEGPREAPVLVCLHGNPTWSFYWRALVRAFSDRYRIVVPDHIGCGLSDKPQSGFQYRLEEHVGNAEALLDHLGIHRCVFVLHDWGGAIGMGVATRHPERAAGFVITNTAAFRSRRIPPSIALCKLPGFGALAVRGFNAFARVATVRATERGLSDEAKAGLLFPYHSWSSRIATLRFVEDIPMHAGHPSWGTLSAIEDGLEALKDRPMRILWGDGDFCFDAPFREEWSRRFPEAEVSAWPDVGHYVMEDAPERVVSALERFLPPVFGGEG